MSEVRLQVKNLCKSFGITKAVQNVSFNVNKGEVHALIGENGSGKSTLTNMLTGIYSIDSGTFVLDGKEIHPKNQVEANEEGVSIIVANNDDMAAGAARAAAAFPAYKNTIFVGVGGNLAGIDAILYFLR